MRAKPATPPTAPPATTLGGGASLLLLVAGLAVPVMRVAAESAAEPATVPAAVSGAVPDDAVKNPPYSLVPVDWTVMLLQSASVFAQEVDAILMLELAGRGPEMVLEIPENAVGEARLSPSGWVNRT